MSHSIEQQTEQLVSQIHAAPLRLVLVASGGGSRAIAELLEVPGASRTLLEAVVPYCDAAMIDLLGGRPEQFCSPRTARAMAVAAWRRAVKHAGGEGNSTEPAGVACTASLASDRPKRGPHRAHVAVQTVERTAAWSLELQKGRRTRRAEEQLVAGLVLNAVAEAAGVGQRPDLPLLEGEQIEHEQIVAPRAWQALMLGRIESLCTGNVPTPGDEASGASEPIVPSAVIFPGAFNPLHAGHCRMAELAGEILGAPVAMEISILNVDKPPLDYLEIARRLRQFPPGQAVWLTRAATFVEKSGLFPGAMFVAGADTLRRIADPRYYAGDAAACREALRQIAARGCRFLVFGRLEGEAFTRLADLALPPLLGELCREVPPEQFREDVSSTALRQARPEP
jgi:nicotinamide mononucleotide (NMN) deamidase PncC